MTKTTQLEFKKIYGKEGSYLELEQYKKNRPKAVFTFKGLPKTKPEDHPWRQFSPVSKHATLEEEIRQEQINKAKEFLKGMDMSIFQPRTRQKQNLGLTQRKYGLIRLFLKYQDIAEVTGINKSSVNWVIKNSRK